MFINDVGENTWEEINDGIAGSNYGWPILEGPSSNPNFRSPVYAYSHNGQPAAITGGAFYNPTTVQFPQAYVGEYFFSDFLNNWIHVFNPVTGTATTFATNMPEGSVDLLVDQAGSLYYLAGPGTNSGEVVRIDYSPTPPPPPPPIGNPPTISQQPQGLTVNPGQSAVFSVVASGSGNLVYQWQRNGRNILGAVLPTYVLPSAQVSDNGAGFSVLVSNAFGQTSSGAAILTVRVTRPPSPAITSPRLGPPTSPVSRSASAVARPILKTARFPPRRSRGRSTSTTRTACTRSCRRSRAFRQSSFTVPQMGDLSPSVFYRITLTATDAEGLSQSTHVDVSPHTAVLGLITQPAGLPLSLDGQTEATPGSVTGVSGMIRSLAGPFDRSSSRGSSTSSRAGRMELQRPREVSSFRPPTPTSWPAINPSESFPMSRSITRPSRCAGEKCKASAWSSVDRSTQLPRRTGPITGWSSLAAIESSARATIVVFAFARRLTPWEPTP